VTSRNYEKQVIKELGEIEKLSTLNKLKKYNTQEYLDKMLNFNADNLTYVALKEILRGLMKRANSITEICEFILI